MAQKLPAAIVFADEKEIKQLDAKDRKIFSVLAHNSRVSLTQLGKIVALSQENLFYRIKKLQQQKVIIDFFTAIDSRKLGIVVFVIFLKLSKISKDGEEKLISYFVKNKHISWITTTAGQFDMILMVQAMSVYEFESVWQAIVKDKGEHFAEIDIGIMTELNHSPAYYPVLENTFQIPSSQLNKMPYARSFSSAQKNVPKIISFDKQDLAILLEMKDNCRIKLTELGEKISMSSQNVDFRIKQLIKKGVIMSFGYRPNYQKLGFQYYTIRLKVGSVDEQQIQKMKKYIATLPECFYYFRMIGQWDFSFHLFYKDARGLNNFFSLLRERFGDIIVSSDSTIHLDQFCYSYISQSSFEALMKKLD